MGIYMPSQNKARPLHMGAGAALDVSYADGSRSRERKKAYTTELENKVLRLEEENENLRKQMEELENMLSCAPPPPQP